MDNRTEHEVSQDDLKYQGALIIIARRRVWDLERELGTRPWSDAIKLHLRDARKEYTRLLKERKELVSIIQSRLL